MSDRRLRLISILGIAIAFSCTVSAIRPESKLIGSSLQQRSSEAQLLYSSNFTAGTLRIKDPGLYRLAEDVEFHPRPDNDFWNEPGDPMYPMGQFYLGFFAAITIEADDVEIDMAGHTLSMSNEFYLLQRFWNAIELNDRVFVENQGVGSLNYQEGDRQQWTANGTIPGLRAARNVYIHDGVLGLSSHAGIHGNGASGVHISNVKVKDFEVAGIQCNGCNKVLIENCVVGPSSRRVPTLATFSHARFLSLYTKRLIPGGFARDGFAHLLDGTISFADRPGRDYSFLEIFDRCERAVMLYRNMLKGAHDYELSAEDLDLLVEARGVFDNLSRLPDGSVLYGILINRLGLPSTDQNYYGGGLESKDVEIRNTTVTGLAARPLEVPSVQTADGMFVQGPARDVLRIFDVVNDGFRGLVNAEYSGNFLSDVYFALWKLSNDFFVERVYGSSCGNFGTNATLPWQLWKGECLDGTVKDNTLTGRDVTLIQKKYFGGLSMSQDIFDWATIPGSSLHKVFISPPHSTARRQHKHYIMCDRDTMFHNMQGVIGIKIRWAEDVRMSGVKVNNLTNTGDDSHWLCRDEQKYKLPENKEDFLALHSSAPGAGSDVRGVEIEAAERVSFKDVAIDNLDSDEGQSIGIEVEGDTNDRSDYPDKAGVSFSQTSVMKLTAGHGMKAIAFKMAESKIDTLGITTDDPADNHNNFIRPKTFVMYEAAGAVLQSDGNGLPNYANSDTGVVDRWMARSSFTSEEQLKGFRSKVIGYLVSQYGLEFHEPEATPLRHPIWVKDSDSYVAPFELGHQNHYKGVSVCTDTGGCTEPSVNSFIHDYPFLLVVGSSGLMLHGVFGSEQGQFAEEGNVVFSGTCNFENFTVPGSADRGNLEVQYFGIRPVQTRPIGGPDADVATFYADSTVESDQLGHGRATGAYINRRRPDGTWELWGSSTQVYQDTPHPRPKFAGIRKNQYAENEFPTPDVAFNWIADGAYPVADGEAGAEISPYPYQHHMLRGAGIKYLKRWTSVNDDNKIRTLRYQFMVLLRDRYGIKKSDPDVHLNDPITNQIDLGGGNFIAPYVVNHVSNQRMITKKRSRQMVQFESLDCRLHEGGFRLFVGRAGINTTGFNYLPFGSMIVKGIYLLENDPDIGNTEVAYQSSIPMIANEWTTAVLEQELVSEKFGDGHAYIILPKPHQAANGLTVNYRGAFVFKDAEGTWPGVCPNCSLEGPYSEFLDLSNQPSWDTYHQPNKC